MPRQPTTRLKIFALLTQHGPMTITEISIDMKIKPSTISASLLLAYNQQLLHIVGYRRQIGTQGRPAPVYKLGPGVDKAPPKISDEDQLAAAQRYREKYAQVIKLRRDKKKGKPATPWSILLDN
tara:strand:+ start:254 stop:625 length:372 start_codon:yes stop_codon:yes gene_type:complete